MSAQSAKPSVLFLNRVFPPAHGATGRLTRDLAMAFAKDGWQVNVICADNAEAIERHKNADIRVQRVKAPIPDKKARHYIRAWRRMYKAAKTLPRQDLVISLTDPPLMVVAGQRLAKRWKAAHMHWCHDLYPDLLPVLGIKISGFIYKLLHTISRRAMRKCHKIVVIGRDMAKYLMAEGIEGGRISVIPNWPNFELLNPPEPPENKNAQKPNGQHHYETDIRTLRKGQEPMMNLFKDKNNPRFRILYAGTIGMAHPVDAILEAALKLNEDNPEIEFVFVGDGPAFDKIAQYRAMHNLQNIRLIPYQPPHRLRDLMESGDVHLVSMPEEAAGKLVPSKLYAALAVSRPVIFMGPQESEICRVLKDFNAGATIPPNNTTALVKAIRKYRYDSDAWFAAQNGAAEGGEVFVPKESIIAWLKRSRYMIRHFSAGAGK